MKFLLPFLIGLVVVVGCSDAPESDSSAVSATTDTATATDSESGADVTSEYIQDGEDSRVSPHGKTRSSIPDEILLLDVDYENLNSGGSGSYTLEVDFMDGEPIRINFPNGGWTHVFPTECPEGWECSEGDRTFTIHRPESAEE